MEKLTKRIKDAWNRLFGPSKKALRGPDDPLSRDYVGTKPENDAVYRFSAASEIRKIVDKGTALAALTNAYTGSYSDYRHNSETYQIIINEAKRKAEEFGATKAEIDEAVSRGKVSGAQENMRLDND